MKDIPAKKRKLSPSKTNGMASVTVSTEKSAETNISSNINKGEVDRWEIFTKVKVETKTFKTELNEPETATKTEELATKIKEPATKTEEPVPGTKEFVKAETKIEIRSVIEVVPPTKLVDMNRMRIPRYLHSQLHSCPEGDDFTDDDTQSFPEVRPNLINVMQCNRQLHIEL